MKKERLRQMGKQNTGNIDIIKKKQKRKTVLRLMTLF